MNDPLYELIDKQIKIMSTPSLKMILKEDPQGFSDKTLSKIKKELELRDSSLYKAMNNDPED